MPNVLSDAAAIWLENKSWSLHVAVVETENHLQHCAESVDAFGFTPQLTRDGPICLNALARVSLMPFINQVLIDFYSQTQRLRFKMFSLKTLDTESSFDLY